MPTKRKTTTPEPMSGVGTIQRPVEYKWVRFDGYEKLTEFLKEVNNLNYGYCIQFLTGYVLETLTVYVEGDELNDELDVGDYLLVCEDEDYLNDLSHTTKWHHEYGVQVSHTNIVSS